MQYYHDVLIEWSKISNLELTPEDYGYLALFLSIVKRTSCDKSTIKIRGRGAFVGDKREFS